jgi:hypothetical protein
MMDIEKLELLMERPFSELDQKERELALSVVESEQEYESMREFYRNIGTEFDGELYEPSDRTKKELDAVFYEVHPKNRGVGLMAFIPVLFPSDKKLWQQPMLRIAAVLVLALLLFRINETDPEPVRVAEVKESLNGKNLLNEGVEAAEKTKETKERETISNDNDSETWVASPVSAATTSRQDRMPDPSASVPIDETVAGVSDFAHPDGIYAGGIAEVAPDLIPVANKPVSSQPHLLDLLTASF